MRHPLRIFHFDESAHTPHLSVCVPLNPFRNFLLGRCEALSSLAPISSVFIIRKRQENQCEPLIDLLIASARILPLIALVMADYSCHYSISAPLCEILR
jgi:hypothetical protein